MDDRPLPPFLADLDRRVKAAQRVLAQALAECQDAVDRVHRTLDPLAPGHFPLPPAHGLGNDHGPQQPGS
jgi:hypothetical protein